MADQTTDKAQRIITRQQKLESDRSIWTAHWKEIAERILPRQNDFFRTPVGYTEGLKNTERIFDSTAVLALDRAASAIESLITPSTSQYHKLEPEDDRLHDNREVKLYLDEINKMLFRLRYRPKANFPSQSHECYISLMAFGTQAMFVDDIPGVGTRYKSCGLNEMYISENSAGIVDYVHRKFPYSSRAAYQKWGNKLPEPILQAAEKDPFRKWEFIHAIYPRDDIQFGRRDYKGMAWESCYVSLEGQVLLSEGGYRTIPYLVSRHVTAPRETYGRSPAMQVLPDIKMVNEMEKTIIRAAHKVVDPPLLLYGDGALSAFNSRPNALNFGGVDEQGRQLVHPMKTGSNLPIAFDMTEQKRKVINDAFYITLFQILVDNPQMTATEAMIRAQEKGQLLAPTVGRQQSEFLGPLIEREIDILSMAGVLPPMPDVMRKSGGGFKVTYTSPLSRLQRAEDGVAIMRTIEQLTPIANIRPEVMDIFDEDGVARELAEINGVPEKVLVSPEAMAAKRQQRAQEQATMQDKNTLDNAQTAANAAKNLGQAAQAAGFTQPATQPT